ncbi:hypothetical protein GTV15_20730 [Streptomyces sp. SID7803]|nr:hypothetical protein [Streptomyces sp. SID7803]
MPGSYPSGSTKRRSRSPRRWGGSRRPGEAREADKAEMRGPVSLLRFVDVCARGDGGGPRAGTGRGRSGTAGK